GGRGDVDEHVWISFYFRWENSSPNRVLLENVLAHLVVNGSWWIEADYSLFYTNDSDVEVTIELQIFELWHQPPTPPLMESKRILSMGTLGGFYSSGGKTKYAIIANSYDVVEYSSFVVPPEGVVIFEVKLDTRVIITGSGGVVIPYEGTTSFLCPFVQFKASEVVKKGPPL